MNEAASASDSASASDQSMDNINNDDIDTSDPVNQDEDDTIEEEGVGDNTNDTREQGTAHGNNGSERTVLVRELTQCTKCDGTDFISRSQIHATHPHPY